MNVVVRADSSRAIGTGHVMRCLTLAEALREGGATVSFVCRDLPGNISSQIETRGYRVALLPAPDAVAGKACDPDDYAAWLGVAVDRDARETRDLIAADRAAIDWLIVDHYALDAAWHRAQRSVVGNIMVIDDLANRKCDCDVLLDQNLAGDAVDRYGSLTPEVGRLLLGPRYALLRPEFAEARRPKRALNRFHRLLVFMGGVDRPNLTARTIEALSALQDRDFEAQIIVGRANPHRRELAKTCSGLANVTYYEQVDDMAARMAASDLAVGAGGTTTWERCAVGLPSLIVSVAENQVPIAREAERIGVGRYLGSAEEVTVDRIRDEVERLRNSPETLMKMRQHALTVVDGRGVERVVRILLEWSGRDGR